MKLCLNDSREHEHCEDLRDSKGDLVVVCHDCQQTLGKKTEIYSRVVGYMRPVGSWNGGKQAEFAMRKTYVGI
jgi:anaerobic ribonucleoside-triphosphate reductase